MKHIERTEGGQLVAADSFRVYPARWNEVHRGLGSINDKFSVPIHRLGNRWFILSGAGRWSFVHDKVVQAYTFGPDTLTDSLDTAIEVASRLAEARTNVRGETFAQIAYRLLDDPDPDMSHPDVKHVRERQAASR